MLIRRSDQEEHAAGELALVSGTVEDASNEQDVLEQTIKREVGEEIGTEVVVLDYVKSHAFIMNNEPAVDIVFLCKHVSGEPTANEPDEVASVHWMTLEEIESSNDAEWVKKSVRLTSKKL